MNKIILHLPHSRTKLPKSFWVDLNLSKEKIDSFNNLICDTKTDKLFGKNCYKKIITKFSRIFCDVEKFEDDNLEVMSKFGMGVIYTKTHLGEVFKDPNDIAKEDVLKTYYRPYHNKLTQTIKKISSKKSVILVDCHSFSKNGIMFTNKTKNLPEICIGYNKNYNKKLISFIDKFFIENKYLVAHNYPYEGALLPNNLIEGKNLACVMLEINKSLYLKDKQNFLRVQKDINKLLKAIRTFKF